MLTDALSELSKSKLLAAGSLTYDWQSSYWSWVLHYVYGPLPYISFCLNSPVVLYTLSCSNRCRVLAVARTIQLHCVGK